MYSRNLHGRSSAEERPFIIPENYRGNAFGEKSAAHEPDGDINTGMSLSQDEREEDRIRVMPRSERSQSPVKTVPYDIDSYRVDDRVKDFENERINEERCDAEHADEDDKPVPSAPGIFGGKGFGFEDLVLIGMILLMSQSEGNDDLILTLALLLLLS